MLETIVNAWKVKDIRNKLIFTFAILIVFRIGSFIPVPFIDASAIAELIKSSSSFSYLELFGGAAFSRATLFALGISPYITSSIVIQLLGVAIPALEALTKEGPEGQKKIAKLTRYVTLGLALLQAFAYYLLNKRQQGIPTYASAGADIFVGVVVVATFTAGAMLLVWLGEQIDKKGIGNGTSMILFAGIIARVPDSIRSLVKDHMIDQGGWYYVFVPLVAIVFIAMVVFVVIMTSAERRIPVQYAKRVVGRKMYGGQSSFMPIKVTMSGVMPVIFAGSILAMPTMIKMFVTETSNPTLFNILGYFEPNNIFYVIVYVALIIGFNYFQLAIQYDPLEMANNLRKNSGTVPGIRPGQPTADFIKRVMDKITLVGALFIAAICVLPIIASMFPAFSGMQLALTGTSLIIVVGVALDTVKELESQMMMRHYRGFLE